MFVRPALTRISLFSALSLLTACATTPVAGDSILILPEAVQVQAHVDCQATRGVYAPHSIHISRMSRGRTFVTTKPSAKVSAHTAQIVNECAQDKLLSNGAGSVIDVQSHQVVLSQDKLKPRTARRKLRVDAVTAGCSRRGGLLQGGAAICPGH